MTSPTLLDEFLPFLLEDEEPDFAKSSLPALHWNDCSQLKIAEYHISVSVSYLLFSLLQPTNSGLLTSIEDTFDMLEVNKALRVYLQTNVFSNHPPNVERWNIEDNLLLVELCRSKVISDHDISAAYRRHTRPRQITKRADSTASQN